MEKKGKGKLLAITQIFILTLAIISFSFIVSTETVSAESPSLRTIPGGRSADPYTTQQIKQLSQMSAEEIYENYNGMEVSAEKQIIRGPSQNVFDIGAYLSLGAGLSSLVSRQLLMKVAGPRLFYSLTDGVASKILGPLRSAFIGGQLAKLVLNVAGASDRNLQVASTGAYVGAGVGAVAGIIFADAFAKFAIFGFAPGPGWVVGGIAFVVTFIWQAFGHQKYSREVFTYKPGLWLPEPGGENCEKCNDLEYGCSEYQCRTFGAACTLINPDTDDALCVWENKGDITPPSVQPLPDSLLTNSYSYVNTETGAKITYNGGCLPAFEGVTMGVLADKPSRCMYDIERKKSFEEMVYATNFGITAYLEEHKVAFSNTAFPSQYAAESLGLTFKNGEDVIIYFWCESVNGIPMPSPYTLSFCVDDSPDLTAPKIISTTPIQDSYITSGTQTMPLYVYTNEPADCSWDFNDKSYEEMTYPMFNCSQNAQDMKSGFNYGCMGELNGLKDTETNKYYIRCKDKPSLNLTDPDQKEKRVANEESYILNLIGTKGLVIDKILINNNEAYSSAGTGENKEVKLKDSTNQIDVEIIAKTSQGAQGNGEARCTYRKATEGLQIFFTNEGSIEFMNENTQGLNLFEGYHEYEIKCCDAANNCDSKMVEITIETDLLEPIVARAYRSDGQMTVITTEYGNCVYGVDGCSYPFEDGTELSTYDHLEHTTPWDTDVDKYIKCEDQYGNQPPVSECSIIVRAYEGYSN